MGRARVVPPGKTSMIEDRGVTGMPATLPALLMAAVGSFGAGKGDSGGSLGNGLFEAGRQAPTPDNPDDDPGIAFVKDVSNKHAIAHTWVKA